MLTLSPLDTLVLRSLDNVAERLVNWVPYLLSHLNDFINKFHSNVVNLGPRVFMTCYLSQSSSELESWFLNLWNHFIIPYLMGTIMAGIEVSQYSFLFYINYCDVVF